MKFVLLVAAATGVFGLRHVHKHSKSTKQTRTRPDLLAVEEGLQKDANPVTVPREMLVWGKSSRTFFSYREMFYASQIKSK